MKWLAAVLALTLMASQAWAMGWYPIACCSGRDCEEIGVDFIGETEAGWNIKFCSATRPGLCIEGFFARGKEQPSMDGAYHICFNYTRIICFFEPKNT